MHAFMHLANHWKQCRWKIHNNSSMSRVK